MSFHPDQHLKIFDRASIFDALSEFCSIFRNKYKLNIAQAAGAVEYTDCTSAEG